VVIKALVSKECTFDYFYCEAVVGVSSSKYRIFIGKILSQKKLNCLDTPCLKITSENNRGELDSLRPVEVSEASAKPVVWSLFPFA
jgi:hypothetical protein